MDERYEKLRSVFDSIDVDHGGTIDRGELKDALARNGLEFTDEQIMTMMKLGDSQSHGGDGDGEIDYKEFRHIMKIANAASKLERIQAKVQRSDECSPAVYC